MFNHGFQCLDGIDLCEESLGGEDVLNNTGNVQGDEVQWKGFRRFFEAKVLQLRDSAQAAAAALHLECLGHGQLRQRLIKSREPLEENRSHWKIFH